jgi:hypothetical protein
LSFDAWRIRVFTRTELVVLLSQEPERLSGHGTSDLAIALFRPGAVVDGQFTLDSLHSSCPSKLADNVSLDVWLEEGEYIVVPLAFNHAVAGYARPFVLALLSLHPVETLSHYELGAEAAKKAVCLYATDLSAATRTNFAGAVFSTRSDGSTLLVHAAYPAPSRHVGFSGWRGGTPIEVEVTVSGLLNMSHGRFPRGPVSGEFITTDVIHPGDAQLLCAAAPVAEAFGYCVATKFRTAPHLSMHGSSSSPSERKGSLFSPYLIRFS